VNSLSVLVVALGFFSIMRDKPIVTTMVDLIYALTSDVFLNWM
jgi:hypothetical protein